MSEFLAASELSAVKHVQDSLEVSIGESGLKKSDISREVGSPIYPLFKPGANPSIKTLARVAAAMNRALRVSFVPLGEVATNDTAPIEQEPAQCQS